ncbi:PREDICTED: piggyBac transposable element-derived protein 3-like [Priapulus caudatus]|uniref:PiggyBac transposable element-derived protein 3-like n=1 Tax=Priapulus caudatus TaxID=37621 RepID=A0ABM1F236_PRICU|nr:PREDICTED: piggyBac transposable element-derived protein 3-like [Priapulus caudatus]
MFLAHFDTMMLEFLVLETNRLRLETRARVKTITMTEIRKFIGVLFYMTVVDIPFRRMYWSAKTRQTVVADAMTVNRFDEIFSLLHSCDNALQKERGADGYDRLYKVRDLITQLNENITQCAEMETCLSVDEQIIPFKGRHSLKIYMKNKPKKWGYKVWVLAGQSGYAHKLQFYGDNTVEPTGTDLTADGIGASGEVVLQLLEGVPPKCYCFFDNYFASPALLAELKKKEIYATCTMRKNRTNGCPLLSEKELKKKGRGTWGSWNSTL